MQISDLTPNPSELRPTLGTMRNTWILLLVPLAANAAEVPGVHAAYAKLPLSFEANRGQTDPQVQFLSRGPGYALFLTRTGAVMKLGDRAVLGMKLAGANSRARVEGLERQAGNSNYFIGNDPSQWRTEVPNYAKVRVGDVYPGIDLIYYGNQRELEYDWIVKPGGDPSRIRFKIEGAEPRVDAAGNLLLKTPAGEVKQRKPVVYQGERRIEGGFIVRGRRVGFEVAAYDRSRALVIDPVLAYSTYLGGSGTDLGYGMAVNGSGNAYVMGRTVSTNFPTANPLQVAQGGGTYDAFVTKISADGSTKVYSTYLGGSGDDIGGGIAVDGLGNAYVTGYTSSTNFPTKLPFQASHHGGGNDAFVTKINNIGSALVYSTYLGGSGDDHGTAIAVDPEGGAYVTGDTSSTNFPTLSPFQANNGGQFDAFVTYMWDGGFGGQVYYSSYFGGSRDDGGSAIAVSDIKVNGQYDTYVTGYTNSTNFPIANPLQASNGGGYDAFVMKLYRAALYAVYSTYLGGSGDDAGNGIAVDASGNAYVTGYTSSTNFPTQVPLQANSGGGYDAFVTKINAAGSASVFSTYLGGSGVDLGEGIALDGSGNAYVTGITNSTDFPIANPLQAANGGFKDAFVTKISADGSTKLYSTYLGGGGDETGLGIALDRSGNAYVTGVTSSPNFPTANPLQAANGGFKDAFVTKISADGSTKLYSTYLGGGGDDIGRGIALDRSGNAYVTGFTSSPNFPTANPLQAANGGGLDAFVSVISGAMPTKVGIWRPSLYNMVAQDVNGNIAWDGGIDRAAFFGATGDIVIFGDWDGSGTTKMGIFRPSVGMFALDMNGNGAWDPGIDRVGFFGQNGDVPIVGDWTGDGKIKIGIYRPSTSLFALDINNNLAWDVGIDQSGVFGQPGDTPIVGKWTLDGKSKVGIFRNGLWSLDTNGNLTWDAGVDASGTIGQAGDTPLLGDWNGDGRTKVGIYRPSFAMFGLDYNGNLAWDAGIDRGGGLGPAGSTPVVGDWTGAGVSRVGIFYGSGYWALDTNGNLVWDAGIKWGAFGSATDTPVVGKWQ